MVSNASSEALSGDRNGEEDDTTIGASIKIDHNKQLSDSSFDGNDTTGPTSGNAILWAKMMKTIEIIEKNQQTQSLQIQQIKECQEHNTSSLDAIRADKADTTFLVDSLKATTEDRDELRLTVRSQAGKMGAVTREMNVVLKKNSKLEAEKVRTVEHSEVIDEIRQAEKRVSSHLGIKDQPLGDPSDNYPYNLWIDEFCDEFRVRLKKNYEKAPEIKKRHDLPPLGDFPNAAKSRLFQYALAVALATPQDTRNLENSPAKHKYDLVKLSGPIFEEGVFAKLRKSFETQIEYLCNKLSEPYAEYSKIYPHINCDAFLHCEVREFSAFYCYP